MISLTDALTLAYTKIKTRRIRLFSIIVSSSILFGVLAAGSLVLNGAMTSFEKFATQGYTSRYILSGNYAPYEVDFEASAIPDDPDLVTRAETLEKTVTARKKAEAKRLGIDSIDSDQDKVTTTDQSGAKHLNYNSPIVQQAMREKAAADPYHSSLELFKKQVSGAKTYYSSIRMRQTASDAPRLSVIVDGKERQPASDNSSAAPLLGATTSRRGVDEITSEWTLIDAPLLQPFILKGQTLDVGSDGSIPIIVSYTAAQEMLKLPTLTNKASNQEQKDRLLTVRKDIAGKTFQVCYRNASSASSLQDALAQQSEIHANANKKDYQKPELVYAPNPAPCAAPVVERDARSSETKQYDAKIAEYNKTFGKAEPTSSTLTFRVIGISPDKNSPAAMDAGQILSYIMSANTASSWASPLGIRDSSPATRDIFADDTTPPQMFGESQVKYYAEFSSASHAQTALTTQSCDQAIKGITPLEGQVFCKRDGRQYQLQPFGSSSLAIENSKKAFAEIQKWAAIVVACLAGISIMGMVGRIIADSRRETAIFRAIGASRLTIAQIYLTYTAFLIVLVSLFALIAGTITAAWVDATLSPSASANALLLFNAQDVSQQFRFIGFDLQSIGFIVLTIACAAFAGALLPIVNNVRRNPINDMRSE